MCEVNRDESMMKTKEIPTRVMKTCMKCSKPASVVARIQDPMCGDCFQSYFTHRFRATFGKSKVVRTGDKVLIAFSGGQSSCVMLHLVKEGLGEGVHKKLRYVPGVIFVDESTCLNRDDDGRSRQLEEIEVWLKESEFPAYMTSLEEVMRDTEPDVRVIAADQSSDAEEDPPGESPGYHKCREKFMQLWNSTTALTAKEDLIATLRLKLLKRIAVKLGYSKVMFGDSATRLAAGILSDLAKGRGATVSRDMSFLDDRDKDVSVIRPMREFTSREISLFCHQCDLKSVFIPQVSTKAHQYASINVLTEEFVNGLQSNFPATVSTVMRTGAKLTSDNKADGAAAACVLCQSPLDASPLPCSASAATQYSQGLQRLAVPEGPQDGCVATDPETASDCCGQGDGSCRSLNRTQQLSSDDLSGALCYGCRVMIRDVKNLNALPGSVIDEASRQKRRAEMKSEIADFLLDEESHDER